MPKTPLRSQLSSEQVIVHQLSKCIETERSALIQMDLDNLKQCTQTKEQLLLELAKCIQCRLDAYGIESESSWDQYVKQYHYQDIKLWDSLKADFERLLQQSAANALAITTARARNRQLKDLICHKNNSPSLYNKQGTPDDYGSRNLGEA